MKTKVDKSVVKRRFGRMKVLSLVNEREQADGPLRWLCLCKCDCGAEWKTRAGNVLAGSVNGCRACAPRFRKKRPLKPIKPEYKIWVAMRRRCRSKNRKDYPDYGGRGIKVCARWMGKGGFARFLNDMGARPSPEHSLDRYPDNNGNYKPGNVRWATKAEQNGNRRDSRTVELNGETMSAAELARRCGVHRKTVYRHLDDGKTPAEIFAWFVH